MKNPYSEFTEEGYINYLKIAKSKYTFLSYSDALKNKPGILWRHDVDGSMHRAYKLAMIEQELGVFATYFIYLNSNFYNALEKEVSHKIRYISSLGHDIGLHFDPSFHDLSIGDTKKLEECVQKDKIILENVIGVKPSAVSFHNPDVGGNWLSLSIDQVCGLPFAHAPVIQNNYVYCSDSNGYWRFKPLIDVLNENHQKLHILTHPTWWIPEPLSPRERIQRCIDGRAEDTGRKYDDLLESLGRQNIR